MEQEKRPLIRRKKGKRMDGWKHGWMKRQNEWRGSDGGRASQIRLGQYDIEVQQEGYLLLFYLYYIHFVFVQTLWSNINYYQKQVAHANYSPPPHTHNLYFVAFKVSGLIMIYLFFYWWASRIQEILPIVSSYLTMTLLNTSEWTNETVQVHPHTEYPSAICGCSVHAWWQVGLSQERNAEVCICLVTWLNWGIKSKKKNLDLSLISTGNECHQCSATTFSICWLTDCHHCW